MEKICNLLVLVKIRETNLQCCNQSWFHEFFAKNRQLRLLVLAKFRESNLHVIKANFTEFLQKNVRAIFSNILTVERNSV